MNLKELRKAAKARKIEWKRHVLERMLERDIGRAQVLKVLEQGEVIEDYADNKPFPSVLILGFPNSMPLHVVAAFDANTSVVYVVTVYEPKKELFGPEFRKRKKL